MPPEQTKLSKIQPFYTNPNEPYTQKQAEQPYGQMQSQNPQTNAQNSASGDNLNTAAEVPENPKKTQTTPAGMKLFSGLIQQQEQNTNPFHDGEALPPKESEQPQNTQNSFSGNFNSDYYENESENENPDDFSDYSENSGPEPDFSAENQEEYIANSYEEQNENQNNEAEQGSYEEIHQSNERFTAPDGFSITLGELFNTTIAELSAAAPMLSSALMQTGTWNLHGNKISTTISSEFQKNIIQNGVAQLKSVLKTFCHADIDFEIILKEQAEPETKQIELPPQVRILVNAFKGSVVGGKK